MAKTKSIIDFINCVFINKTPWDKLSESDKKAFSPYMMNRWISMHYEYTSLVNYLQQYNISILKPREVYKLYLDILPKQKFFARYIKSKREKDTKIPPALISFVAEQENWSTTECYDNLSYLISTNDYMSMMTEYLKRYGFSAGEMKTKFKIK